MQSKQTTLMNLWHELPIGPNGQEDLSVVYAIVEIPKGSRNKYEYDKEAGVIRLDRVLYSSIVYPGDYGFLPETYYEDGDPLDILIMLNQPTFPGCVIEARPVGLFSMLDKGQPDDKVLAVPHRDPTYDDIQGLDDVPTHYLREVEHFFKVYKDLEGVRVEPLGWNGAEAALDAIRAGLTGYAENYPERR
jgi:inorganic pyrophosphatase